MNCMLGMAFIPPTQNLVKAQGVGLHHHKNSVVYLIILLVKVYKGIKCMWNHALAM
jgi:hypothetical protein